MSNLASLDKRVNPKDPSGLRSTEEARAKISQNDFDLVLAKIIQRTEGITDPLKINRIVTEELQKYQGVSTQKQITWVIDTIRRSAGRADLMLKTMGVQIIGTLGPVPISKTLRDSLTINVKNQITSLTADTQKKVTQALIDGVNRGDGPKTIAKAIVESTAMEKNRAVLIARTETLRANNDASINQYKKHGIQQVKWLTAHDDRTCDECGPRDGEVYDMDSRPECPAHPNCRCVLLPVIGEEA